MSKTRPTSSKTSAKAAAKPVAATQPMKTVSPAPDAAAAFLREVDEALHQEYLLNLWHRSKFFVLAAVIGMVLAVAGKEAWSAWTLHKDRTLAAKWYAYQELKTDSERLKALPELLKDTRGGTHDLALYAEAEMQQDFAARAKAYMAVVDDASASQWLRDIARLNAALALLEVDGAQAKAQLEILVQADDGQAHRPAYAPAMELLALLAQQAGDTASARGYTVKLLEEPGLPADLRQRALMRLGALGGAEIAQ